MNWKQQALDIASQQYPIPRPLLPVKTGPYYSHWETPDGQFWITGNLDRNVFNIRERFQSVIAGERYIIVKRFVIHKEITELLGVVLYAEGDEPAPSKSRDPIEEQYRNWEMQESLDVDFIHTGARYRIPDNGD